MPKEGRKEGRRGSGCSGVWEWVLVLGKVVWILTQVEKASNGDEGCRGGWSEWMRVRMMSWGAKWVRKREGEWRRLGVGEVNERMTDKKDTKSKNRKGQTGRQTHANQSPPTVHRKVMRRKKTHSHHTCTQTQKKGRRKKKKDEVSAPIDCNSRFLRAPQGRSKGDKEVMLVVLMFCQGYRCGRK